MRNKVLPIMFLAVLSAAGFSAVAALAQNAEPRSAPQAEPRKTDESDKRAEPRSAPDSERHEPARETTPPRRQGAAPRVAPPRVLPPFDYRAPRPYYFPPVSLHRSFYYHPYFGFYYGPYYGPFYPYAGPAFGLVSYHTSAIRTRVKPVETEVYVNGYFAGVVDDFDGLFQRLYLPAGAHNVELHLDGYRNVRQRLYLNPGESRDITFQMQPSPPGESHQAPLAPEAVAEEWTFGSAAPAQGDRPASPFGILTIRVEPADAQILLDGEVWLGNTGRTELVIHMPAGWHQLEVRRTEFQTFTTEIQLSEGATTRLNVRLVR